MRLEQRPPGPKERFPGELLLAFDRDPTGFLSRLANDYGDVVSFRLGWFNVALLNHPDLIKDVLVTHHRTFIQGPGHQQAKRLVGDAMLAADGEHHLRKRRLIQPILHRRHIDTFGTAITDFTAEHALRWHDGQSVDVVHEMWRLTLRISTKTLFGTSVESEAEELYQAIDELASMFSPLGVLLADWLTRVPNPYKRRFETARAKVDGKMNRLIREHRASAASQDLLSLLISAYSTAGDEIAANDSEIRDEALEMFMAAHGTTALALSWAFYLLSQNPAVETRLLAELNDILGTRCPTTQDVPRLEYTRMVMQEAMRLYPPTWVTDRQLVAPFEANGYHLPAGSVVLVSPWTMHHDTRYFPEPYCFEPERWMDERKAQLPDFAYFPFGGGPHMCPGEYMAWFEGILMLATLVPQWKMRSLPQPPVALRPRFSLEAKNGIPMKLERRS